MHVGALIVDDEADIRTLIRIAIDAANQGLFVAGEAANGDEALERLDDVDPEVVLLDEMMPSMTGLETAKRMLQRRPRQIIVMCTAYLDDALKQEAAAAGIKLCLHKDDLALIPEVLKVVGRLEE